MFVVAELFIDKTSQMQWLAPETALLFLVRQRILKDFDGVGGNVRIVVNRTFDLEA